MTDALPHPSEWPNRPVYLAADDGVELNGRNSGVEPLPLGKPVAFETDTFKGLFYLRLRAIPDDSKKHAAYFDATKRFYQFVVQGQFKEEGLDLSDIVLGDVYERKLKRVPHGHVGRMVKNFYEAMSPGMIFDIFDDKQPKVLAPMGGCQTMRVDLPGQEPADFDNLQENTALLGKFGSREERRKVLSKPETAAEYKINTSHVYTMESYDDKMDFGTFHQHMGYTTIDMVPILDGQCLSFGIYKRKSLNRVFKLSLWHERALAKTADSQGQ